MIVLGGVDLEVESSIVVAEFSRKGRLRSRPLCWELICRLEEWFHPHESAIL